MTVIRTAFRLAYTPPYDWASMRAGLEMRALPGVERVTHSGYSRTGRIGAACVLVDAAHVAAAQAFDVVVTSERPLEADDVRVRLVRVLALDRDPAAMVACTAGDPWLASLCARHAGLRVPGGWDPFELACRAVLGQQVSVTAARQLVTTLVDICGTMLPDGIAHGGLHRCFPTPAAILDADLTRLRMPGARKATLRALAEAAMAPDFFDASLELPAAIARLRGVKGIGDWTAHYIALRALRHPDAFPASDAGLLRGATEAGRRPSPAMLLERAEAWRPHRAFAAQLLWAEDAASMAAAGAARPVAAGVS